MIKRLSLAFLFVAVVATATLAARQTSPGYVPPNGFVPDAAAAIRIAEAVWIPIYGEEHIVAERPFKATLKDEVWTVTGRDLPANSPGGVVEAEIAKRDGRILRVIHGQ